MVGKRADLLTGFAIRQLLWSTYYASLLCQHLPTFVINLLCRNVISLHLCHLQSYRNSMMKLLMQSKFWMDRIRWGNPHLVTISSAIIVLNEGTSWGLLWFLWWVWLRKVHIKIQAEFWQWSLAAVVFTTRLASNAHTAKLPMPKFCLDLGMDFFQQPL